MGLIRIDGNALPGKLVGFALGSTIIPMLVYPPLMVVPWQMEGPADWRPDHRYLDAIVRVITALATAIFLARSMSQSLCPTADPKLDPLGKGTARLIDLIMILSIPILVVGWQASVAVVVIASLIAITLRRWLAKVDGLGRLAIGMPVAMTVQVTIWRWSHEAAYWPSEGSTPWVILAWAAAAMTLPMLLRDRPEGSEPPAAIVE
jgi:leader peptidase (prepilin peptidase)/N-methyltransferase